MSRKIILLDIDGVLSTTGSWKANEILNDGFQSFNSRAARNLDKIISKTNADIILTTSHRSRFTSTQWKSIMARRGVNVHNVRELSPYLTNQKPKSRAQEIKEWVSVEASNIDYVIIDDDSSLDDLPQDIKIHVVKTKPLVGLDDEATDNALSILSHSEK